MELQTLLITTFVAAVLADVSMVFGVLPFYFVKNMSDRVTGIMAAAAAGMMAAASLVQLVGEGLEKAPGIEAWEVSAGLAAGALLYAAAAHWVRDNERFDLMNLRKSGGAQSLLIVAAMTVHSAPEGVAIGVAFGSKDVGLGYSVVSALAVHNIPEAIAITLALRANGVPRPPLHRLGPVHKSPAAGLRTARRLVHLALRTTLAGRHGLRRRGHDVLGGR
ncbi:ZIP family metal transporter [Haloferula sp. A504]|uniref:ZIP family metal transporter n=1 Tax=Haloferula sp. A504 TaxID=3373601 RepID=UPI0031BF6D74|nr:hypothetical protein [Verrucomicrobiaceae bacterium E54]